MESEGEFNMYKKYIAIIMGIVLIGSSVLSTDKGEAISELEKRGENLIRFHVLANSDDPEDQLLKLKIRDKIITAMAEEMETSKNIEETRNIIKNNLKNIEEIAEKEVLAEGKDYKVSAMLTEDTFPTRRYGGIVFPAGRYEALKVEIGEGVGKNWWCVMFPPLCFVDVKNGLTDEKTQQELKNTLTEEEYRLFYTATKEEELPLQLKSKIIEVFQVSKSKFGNFASVF